MTIEYFFLKKTALKGEIGYSAFVRVGKNAIATEGETFEELDKVIVETPNFNVQLPKVEVGFISYFYT